MLISSDRAKAAADINWRYIGDAIPAFLTIAIMPFTYSIAYGLIAGIISYMVLNTIVWIVEKVSGGKIKPADKEYKDPWTWRLEGGVLPPWLTRAAKGKKDFWRPYEDIEHRTGNTYDGKDVEVDEQAKMANSDSGVVRDSSSEGEKVKV